MLEMSEFLVVSQASSLTLSVAGIFKVHCLKPLFGLTSYSVMYIRVLVQRPAVDYCVVIYFVMDACWLFLFVISTCKTGHKSLIARLLGQVVFYVSMLMCRRTKYLK